MFQKLIYLFYRILFRTIDVQEKLDTLICYFLVFDIINHGGEEVIKFQVFNRHFPFVLFLCLSITLSNRVRDYQEFALFINLSEKVLRKFKLVGTHFWDSLLVEKQNEEFLELLFLLFVLYPLVAFYYLVCPFEIFASLFWCGLELLPKHIQSSHMNFYSERKLEYEQ